MYWSIWKFVTFSLAFRYLVLFRNISIHSQKEALYTLFNQGILRFQFPLWSRLSFSSHKSSFVIPKQLWKHFFWCSFDHNFIISICIQLVFYTYTLPLEYSFIIKWDITVMVSFVNSKRTSLMHIFWMLAMY